jgi:VWFA-related protein
MHFCRCCTVWLVLLPLVAVSLSSQTTVPDSGSAVTTVQAKVRVVLVDVVVTSGKGDSVTGLHKEDFEVSEDGKLQTIASFAEHQGAPPTQIELPPMPPNVYTNYPLTQTADSVNVLLLDALNTQARDQTYVHSEMIKYLKTIPPGTRVAIFTLASRLRMLQGMTTDSSVLLAVLNDKKGAAGTHQSALLASGVENDANQRIVDFMAENSGTTATPQTLAQAEVDPINAMKQFLADTAAFQTDSRTRITLQALQQLGRYLSEVPGRKNVIWFSGSFPAGILPDPDLPDPFAEIKDFQQEVRKTAALLTASQVALYPVGAEGLAPDSQYEANGAEIGEKRGTLVTRDQIKDLRTGRADRDSSHSVMETLAKETGGQASYNTNGLSDVLARVVNNGTRYYTISYSPANKATDGKYRRIQVKLVNGKDKLAYRRGYYADDLEAVLAAGQKPDSDPLLPLMGRNLPDYTQILYKVRVLPTSPQPPPGGAPIGSNTELKGPITRYGVDFAISVADLKLDPTPDGGRRGNIELMLVAYDREGKPLNFVVTNGEIQLQPKVYAGLLQVGLQIHKEIDVPKGDAYLRTGIYDLGSNTAGTLGVPLREAPTPTAAAK